MKKRLSEVEGAEFCRILEEELARSCERSCETRNRRRKVDPNFFDKSVARFSLFFLVPLHSHQQMSSLRPTLPLVLALPLRPVMSINSLLVELIAHILDLADDEPGWPEYYQTMRAAALVSGLWCFLASERLWRWVEISTRKEAAALVGALQRGGTGPGR